MKLARIFPSDQIFGHHLEQTFFLGINLERFPLYHLSLEFGAFGITPRSLRTGAAVYVISSVLVYSDRHGGEPWFPHTNQPPHI